MKNVVSAFYLIKYNMLSTLENFIRKITKFSKASTVYVIDFPFSEMFG